MEAGTRSARTRIRSLTVSPAAFHALAWAALTALFLIVVSGATVRLTGSGLGCENWPRCGETFLPPKDYHAVIEFGNRVIGFAVGITTLIAAAAAFRVGGLPRWVLWSAVALPFTVLAQGVLGGVTVIFELHPLIVMGHFLLSLVALALAALVVLGARGVRTETTGLAWLGLALVPSALALVVTGTLVTAAGPHSGGEDVRRFGDVYDAVHMHIGATAAFGLAFLTLVGGLLLQRRRARSELLLAGGLVFLLAAQMAIGETQWRSGLPWQLVLVHVALGTAVWTGVVALAARLVLGSRHDLA
jgi:cytochrome c oxidase assembly protein subunit 15